MTLEIKKKTMNGTIEKKRKPFLNPIPLLFLLFNPGTSIVTGTIIGTSLLSNRRGLKEFAQVSRYSCSLKKSKTIKDQI